MSASESRLFLPDCDYACERLPHGLHFLAPVVDGRVDRPRDPTVAVAKLIRNNNVVDS